MKPFSSRYLWLLDWCDISMMTRISYPRRFDVHGTSTLSIFTAKLALQRAMPAPRLP